METLIENYKVTQIKIKYEQPSAINSLVSNIYVINMKEDIVKRNYIIALFQKFQLNYTLVLVEKITDESYNFIKQYSKISKNEAGCLLSHLWCLEDIIKKKYVNAIVFEDDIIVHKDFERMLINKINLNFDFLLLGACDFNFSQCNYANVLNEVYYPKQFHYVLGAHGNYYSLEGAKFMYDLKKKHISFFDNFYGDVFVRFPDSSGLCYPNVVISDISSSCLNHAYSYFSEEETFYYNKCFQNFNFTDYEVIYVKLLDQVINSNDVNSFQSYDELLMGCLEVYFKDKGKAVTLRERLKTNFFNLHDIYSILLKS